MGIILKNKILIKINVILLSFALTLALCPYFVSAENDTSAALDFSVQTDEELTAQERIKLLEENEGSFDETSFIIEDTSREEAESTAALFSGSTVRMSESEDMAVVYLPDGTTVEDVYKSAQVETLLPKISENSYISLMDTYTDAYGNILTPEAPDYDITDGGYAYQEYLSYVNLKDTWKSTTGKGITVAIIDTGIDIDNSEFSGKISNDSYNASTGETVSQSGMDVIDDTAGHGTMVASVIAAAMDGYGVVGIAPDVSLLIIKLVKDSSGLLSAGDAKLGIEYAIAHGADIINMSFGTERADVFGTYTEKAYDAGVIMVASAGNNANDTPMYPASDDCVIGVGALGSSASGNYSQAWDLANYSSYGIGTLLAAPGNVYVTARGGSYARGTGTSFAAPVVSAAVALYLSYHGKTTPEYMIKLLKASSVDIGQQGADDKFGYGALDIYTLVFGETVTVTYDAMDQDTDNETQLAIKGHTLQYIPEPVREGYTFAGWHTTDTYENNAVSYSYIYNCDTTLYAKWLETVTYASDTYGGNYYIVTYSNLDGISEGRAVMYKNRQMYLKDDCWYCISARPVEPVESDFTIADITDDDTVLRYDDIPKGDVNGNGKINVIDCQIAYDIFAGMYAGTDKLSILNIMKADFNGDMVINALDARAMQVYIHSGAGKS